MRRTTSSDASTNRHLRAAARGRCHRTAGQAVRQGISSHYQLHRHREVHLHRLGTSGSSSETTAASFHVTATRSAAKRALKSPKQGGRFPRVDWVSGDGSFANPGNLATADTIVTVFVRESAAIHHIELVAESWPVLVSQNRLDEDGARLPALMYDPYSTPDDPRAHPNPRGSGKRARRPSRFMTKTACREPSRSQCVCVRVPSRVRLDE